MVVLVQKYGGGSLTDLSKLETVAKKVKRHVDSGYQIVLVLSALQGETDRLIGLINLLTPSCPQREYDALLATGEQASACLMVMALSRLGVRAQTLNAWQAGIYGDGVYSRSSIQRIDTGRIQSCVDAGVIPVITGFQAVGDDLSVTTLGRGGSDTTAVALAAALDADECQVYVDVPGIFTADPKVESRARLLHRIPIAQMLAYANLGARVMQKRAVACAAKYRVPLRICPTFIEGPGTVMEYDKDHVIEKTVATAVAHANQQVVMQLSGLRSLQSDVTDLYELIGCYGCDIEHTLRQSHDDYHLDCVMSCDDYQLLKSQFERWLACRTHVQCRTTQNLARISVIGFSMVKDIAMTREVVNCCRHANIQVRHLFATDNSISIIIDQAYVELGVRSLHQHFSLEGQNAASLISESLPA